MRAEHSPPESGRSVVGAASCCRRSKTRVGWWRYLRGHLRGYRWTRWWAGLTVTAPYLGARYKHMFGFKLDKTPRVWYTVRWHLMH